MHNCQVRRMTVHNCQVRRHARGELTWEIAEELEEGVAAIHSRRWLSCDCAQPLPPQMVSHVLVATRHTSALCVSNSKQQMPSRAM